MITFYHDQRSCSRRYVYIHIYILILQLLVKKKKDHDHVHDIDVDRGARCTCIRTSTSIDIYHSRSSTSYRSISDHGRRSRSYDDHDTAVRSLAIAPFARIVVQRESFGTLARATLTHPVQLRDRPEHCPFPWPGDWWRCCAIPPAGGPPLPLPHCSSHAMTPMVPAPDPTLVWLG
jgi:hypothetical protein